MPNRLSIFNFKNRDPLTAIILFAVLVVVLEGAFRFLPENEMIRTFQQARTGPAEAPDVQIIGASIARSGIVADEFNRNLESETQVYNGAIPATGPEFAYFLLRRQIEAGKRPNTLLCTYPPHTFGSLRIPLLVNFCDWGDLREIAATGMRPFDTVYGVLSKLSYTLRNREYIAGQLLRKKRATFTASTLPPGAASDASAPKMFAPRFPAENLHPMYRKPFEVHPFNRHFLEKFLTLARENNIKVFWTTMPVLPVVYESRKPLNFDDAYYAMLDDLVARHGVELLQKEFLLFSEAEFQDYTHFNQAGAQKLSRFLAEKLHAARKLSASNGQLP